MRAELLTIGSELTSGATVNTNAAFVARRLADVGIPCQRQVAVSDEPASIVGALNEALRRCDLLVMTGGLGPTFDDVTMEAIAEVTGRPLIEIPTVAAKIRRFYRQRHRKLQRAALRQARIPQGGQALPNPIGTAPGLWLSHARQTIIALPGVPGEMRAIMEQSVLPRLKRFKGLTAIESRTLRTVGIVELRIEALLRKIHIPQSVQVGLYPHQRLVDIRLTATAASRAQARRTLARLERGLRRALGPTVYGMGTETLESVVGALLVKRGKTVAVAESCTGGLVLDSITDVPGSSRYLRGGLVAYHNDFKREALGVPAPILRRYGAVSDPVVRAMARGVRRLAGADLGLAITGIAGPTGGTTQKPVGLVYVGLADSRMAKSLRCQFFGDRASIKAQAAQTALNWLRCYLLKAPLRRRK